MKFEELKYERPSYTEVSEKLEQLLDDLAKQNDAEKFYQLFLQINELTSHVSTMASLASVRHTINTVDPFYLAENEYWDEYGPMYEVYSNRLSKIALAFQNREELVKRIPYTYFQLAQCQLKSFDERIVPLLQKENKLVSEYGKLKASAQIECLNETYNLASIGKLLNSDDEATRKIAYDAKMKFYADHEADFDRIFDELVQVRDEMAKQMGYQNYIELGYYRMNRLDYDQKMVENYRKQILEEMVPVANWLYDKQTKRLGKETLAYYNEGYKFASGNPTPKGDSKTLVDCAVKMYHQLSKETGEFIDMMNDNHLWDLVSRDNKEMGGYCTSFDDYKVPFIFANFNGTSGDVEVLTHEAGHALQYYLSRNIPVTSCQWPTMESCEIHSMSMEFFTYPWMNEFFKEDTDKYYFTHLGGTVEFLPYGVLVDHFQHEIYLHPEMSIDERKQTYRRLEKMYCPHKDYTGCEILEKGCWWYQQGHIFASPFYYIDYTLAQVCALQFFVRTLKKDERAWSDYLHLCSLGGTLSFTKLVKEAGLIVPFEDGCIQSISQEIKDYLSKIDDQKL